MKAFELAIKARRQELREEIALMQSPRDAARRSISPRLLTRSRHRVRLSRTNLLFSGLIPRLEFITPAHGGGPERI